MPILIVIFFAPESPSWLVRHGRYSAAEHSLTRLQSAKAAGEDIPTPAETVAQLVETDNIEKELVHGTTYLECFKGTNLRRTEIATMTWVIQQMCGPVLQTYATYFFLQAGLATSQAFSMTLGLYALAFVGTCLSWPLINSFGRRTIFLWGLIAIFVCLLITGLIGIAPASNVPASWAIGAFLLIFTFIYDFTVGPLTYVIVPEIPSSRLRTKTTVIARNAYNITCIWSGILVSSVMSLVTRRFTSNTSADSLHAQPDQLELGCQGSALLGGNHLTLHYLCFLPAAGDKGFHLRRDRQTLRARCSCERLP